MNFLIDLCKKSNTFSWVLTILGITLMIIVVMY
jgi:hypothetical protein